MVRGVPPEGQPARDHLPEPNFNLVSNNYFAVLGIRLSQGRAFSESEAARAEPVAVISESMSRAYWNGQNALGKRFLYGTKGQMQSVEIDHVAKDVRSTQPSVPARTLITLSPCLNLLR